jgi:hypothetical protein
MRALQSLQKSKVTNLAELTSGTLAALCMMSFPEQFFDGCPQRVPKVLFLFKAVGSPAQTGWFT